MHRGRVVVAMSGGVDSSVAAFLLAEQGYDVVGLFMRTGAHVEEEACAVDAVPVAAPKKIRGCCSAIDAADAQRVADRLNMPFYALNFEEDFNRIKDYFADEYLNARTPNPCVVCNTWLKFGKLWDYAQAVEADFIATGHYARTTSADGGNEEVGLYTAADDAKDQTYFLFGLRRELLPHIL
ncbi:MAG: tRNA 2-thiouridine(34) synthase MnmA, partial [Planctomycetia bacterium]